ncbi:MAG: TetR/AcrR family transcriptional regulator [Planctomycetes bacterium]|nr:TetR/AcrR family transcriptional regulator [Planctomycetota bacterium]
MSDTKDRLLQTAARLFHEQGYHATGVATILREAGVNSGSLYHHFAGKEALLRGVLDWYLDQLRPVITGPVEAAESDPLERIFVLLGNYRAMLESTGCVLGCPIGNLALEVSADHPAVRPLIDANFAQWRAVVASWIDQARDRLLDDVDAEALALFVLTTMEGAIMLARARGTLEPFDVAVANLRRHVELLTA